MKKKTVQNLKELFSSSAWLEHRLKSSKYVTKEYQDFGLEIATKLNDIDRRALYIKLAKNEDRGMIHRALSFALDYPRASNKAKIFMWKMKELRQEIKQKREEEANKQMSML